MVDRIEEVLSDIPEATQPGQLEPEKNLPCTLNPMSSECVQMCQMAEEAECEEHLMEEVMD